MEFYTLKTNPITEVLKESNIPILRETNDCYFYWVTEDQLKQMDTIMKSGDYNGRRIS